MQDNKKEQILNLVKAYIDEKHASKKWEAGTDWVQYAGPYFDSSEYVSAISTLLNEWLVLGHDASTFEKSFPQLLGKTNGIVVNSGSSANLIMMLTMTSKRGFNFPKGTKVITPVAGFPATMSPLLTVGFEPVFVDIELDSLNLDLDQVEQAAKNGAKILTFAHVLGNPPNMDKLMKIVKKYELILLEDCCDALGSTYRGNLLGGYGEIATCSFYPAHHCTSGEGGFVAFKNKEYEKIGRSFRDWGRGCYCVGKKANLSKCGTCGERFSNWLKSVPGEVFDHRYVYDEMSYNLKPLELQCSILLEQMKKLPEIHEKRKINHKRLYDIFKPYEEFFVLPKATEHSDPSWFAFALTIKNPKIFNRFDFCGYLEDSKIQTRNYFGGNLLLQPAYNHLPDADIAHKLYPISTKVTTDTFFLGCSPTISNTQLDYIKLIVDRFFSSYAKINIG